MAIHHGCHADGPSHSTRRSARLPARGPTCDEPAYSSAWAGSPRLRLPSAIGVTFGGENMAPFDTRADGGALSDRPRGLDAAARSDARCTLVCTARLSRV